MVSPYKSEDTQFIAGIESSQDTTVTPTRYPGRLPDDVSPPDPEQEWIITRLVGGDREIFDKHQGQRSYQGGDVPIVPYDGWPLALLLGSETVQADTAIDHTATSETSAGITTQAQTGTDLHTITAKMDGMPPSATIESVYFGRGGGVNLVRTFGGVVPNSGEITVNDDDELQVNIEPWAQSVAESDTETTGVSVQNYDPWKFDDALSNLSLFGSQFARVTEFTASYENELTEGRYIEDTEGIDPFELLYGNASYTLEPTIRIIDDSLYKELINPTAGGFDAIFQFERPNGDTIRFEWTGCNFEDAPHDIPEDAGPIDVDVSITPNSTTIYVEDSNTGGAYI